MPQLVPQKTKTLTIRKNGRSADFITPNFIYGCAGGCRASYCYVMRHNPDKVYINENIDILLDVIARHIEQLPTKTPNQTDDIFWTYDIGCSTDISLHWKHTDWCKVFDFFKYHPRAKATFATKYVNPKLLDYDPQEKIRIRFSLMPQKISTILETKTHSIEERILAINSFIESGYEVHINFSPIVVYEGWTLDYEELFKTIDANVSDYHKLNIKAECIFLTHNEKQHLNNLAAGRLDSELYIWQPKLQESKVSEYGGQAVRYKLSLKKKMIAHWSNLHNKIIPWNKIRYIF